MSRSTRFRNPQARLAASLALIACALLPFRTSAQTAETIDYSIRAFDALLSNTPPTQEIVYVGDMGYRASYLREWTDHLRQQASGRGLESVFNLSSSGWPNGVVPYTYDASMTPELTKRFEESIREWQLAANLKFIQQTTETSYLVISNSLPGGAQDSFVGMQGNKQVIHVNNAALNNLDCAHEIGHALGMEHEQCRSDRDTYVKIHWENFQSGYPTNTTHVLEPNFGILPRKFSNNSTSYDYDSIMEYPPSDGNSGRTPGDPVCSDAACTQIEPLEPYYSAQGKPVLGQNPPTSHLSAQDKYGMGVRYGLPRTISGHVTDAHGAALPGVSVSIAGGSSYRGPASVVSGADGSYSFVGIPNNTGTFTVTASLSGHLFSQGNWTVTMGSTDYTAADFNEDGPPSVTFSPLTDQASVFDFSSLGGKLSKAATVSFRLTEYNPSSANRYWDGSNWVLDGTSAAVTLPATVSANLLWAPGAVLPNRSQTRYGFYVVDVYATDALGLQGTANLVLSRSATVTSTPTLTLATVDDGQVLASSSLPSLAGTASQTGSGIAAVDVFLMRATNPGFVYWTGTAWDVNSTALHANYDASSQVWDVNTTLPSGPDLPNAHYQIQVSASNRESPQGSATISVAFEVKAPGAPTTITVPGTANPWLAGMTNGFAEAGGDSAPAQSPVLFTSFTPGAALQFTASGSADYGGQSAGPTGIAGYFIDHAAEDGIGPIAGSAVDSLIGVFLDDSLPDPSASMPDPLNFSSDASRNYYAIRPRLLQPFYIGSGTNANGQQQNVIVPPKATRLFLGIQDGFGWYNNGGSFAVIVTALPPLPPITAASITGGSVPGDTWSFSATYAPPSVSGIQLRVQSTTTTNVEFSWTDLPGVPYLTDAGGHWTLNTPNVPAGVRYFRIIASALGYADGLSAAFGPFGSTGSATDWDAARDLKRAQLLGSTLAAINPNPIVTDWSYGYRLESDLATTSFALFPNQAFNFAGSADLAGWFRPSNDGPSAGVNITAEPAILSFCCGPLLPINPGEMGLWPGSDGSAAVVRWVAPVTADYALSSYWRKIDINGNNGCVSSVVVNGNVLYTQTWFNGDMPGYTNSVSLSAGDLVDFVLGPASGYSFDGTKFNATIQLLTIGTLPAISSVSAFAASAPIQPNTPWTFTATYQTVPSDLKLRVQFSLTDNVESSWTDLPGNANMTDVDATWTLQSSGVPEGDLYFRVIASASRYSDGRSAILGPFSVVVPLATVTVPYPASSSSPLEEVPELQNPALVLVHALSGVTASFSPSASVFTGPAHLLLSADAGGLASLAVKAEQVLNLPSVALGQNSLLALLGTIQGDLSSGVLNSTANGIDTTQLPPSLPALDLKLAGTVTHDPTTVALLAKQIPMFVSQLLSKLLPGDSGSSLPRTRQVALQSPATQPLFTGLMTVDGNYEQSGGTLAIGIAGTNTVSQGTQQYDQLVVNGTAHLLGGSVVVGLFDPNNQTNLAGAFQPPNGAAFDVVVANRIEVSPSFTVRGQLWGDDQFFNWGIVTRPDGWQALRLVATPNPPVLNVQPSGAMLQLSYPAGYTGYTLESTATLLPANWTTLSTGTNQVVLSPANATQFYRLRKP
jgi:hypothetical protein